LSTRNESDLAATIALTGFSIFAMAFLIRFLIAIHHELRHRADPAVFKVPESSGGEIWIERPTPGVAHAILRSGRLKGDKLEDVETRGRRRIVAGLNLVLAGLVLVASAASATAQTTENSHSPADHNSAGSTKADDHNPTSATLWEYGAFLDAAYLLDFNHPENQLFRSRGTAYKLDEPLINMAGAYIRKTPTESSRWGVEVTAQAGQDTRVFGFSPTAPNLSGYQGLRHLGPTNVSYLLPVGKGLTIQGGIFSSLIGYDSLYAKDNFNYTRPWGADFTPYLMLGINASYPVTSKVTLTGFAVNGYWHLSNANSVPNWGGQAAYKPNERWSMKQTILIGPHQSETGLKFWRILSDSIIEWKRNPLSVGFEFQGATEKVATGGFPHAAWVSSQLPVHYAIDKHWSLTVRPEVAWDSDGRWTGFPQTIKAVTSTVEYRVPYKQAAAILRLEHRFDDSRGLAGGFFSGTEVAPGVVSLTPSQHLLVFDVILTFDAEARSRRGGDPH
jgi:hypothetical protein